MDSITRPNSVFCDTKTLPLIFCGSFFCSFRENFNMLEGLSVDSRELHSPKCAPTRVGKAKNSCHCFSYCAKKLIIKVHRISRTAKNSLKRAKLAF